MWWRTSIASPQHSQPARRPSMLTWDQQLWNTFRRRIAQRKWVLRGGGHRDTPGEDARNPRCSGELYLALPLGGAFAHDRGVRRALLEGVHAAPAPPLG